MQEKIPESNSVFDAATRVHKFAFRNWKYLFITVIRNIYSIYQSLVILTMAMTLYSKFAWAIFYFWMKEQPKKRNLRVKNDLFRSTNQEMTKEIELVSEGNSTQTGTK